MRVAVLDDTMRVAAGLADWASLGSETTVDFVEAHLDPDALVARIADAEVVVAMRERTPIDAAVLDRLPALRLLITTGMRNAAIDVGHALDRGVTVCGTGAGQTPTAELTWALILGLVRDVAVNDRVVRAGGWQTRPGGDLAGRTLGIVGLGRLGSRVARVAKAFDMDVIAWSPHLTPERASEGGARAVSKQALFREADIVSIHLVLSEATRGVVGADEIAQMSPQSFLVNCSRSALVDQDALRSAIEGGRIGGAALDVFAEEPLPHESWMASSDRVLLSPHMGYVTEGNYALMYADVVEDVRAWREGSPLRLLDRPPVQS